MDFAQSLEGFIKIGSTIFMDRFSQVFQEKGFDTLTMRQFKYLEIIADGSDITSSVLAEIFKVKKPTITTVVNELMQQGLLVKEKSIQDARVFYLRLTASAKELFEIKKDIFKEQAELIESAISKNQYKELTEIFNLLITKYNDGIPAKS